MNLKLRSILNRYWLSVVAPAFIAVFIQLSWPFFKESPGSLFLAAIMFCAWHGGLGPGLSATVVSILLADYFFVVPYWAFWAPDRDEAVKLLTIGSVGVVSTLLCELMRNSQLRAENALTMAKEEKKRYRSLVKSTADLVWNTDPHHKLKGDAELWFQFTGQSESERAGTGWINAIHPEDQEVLKRNHAKTIDNLGPYELEARIRRNDGSYLNYFVRGVPTPAEGQHTPAEWLMIATETRESKRVKEQFHQIIDGSPNGMLLVDQSGRIVLVNAEIERLFRYQRGELIGQTVELLVPRRFRDHHPQNRRSFVNEPAARPMGAGRDLFGLRSDQTEFPVEIGLNPIETDQGLMVLGTVVDITARKLAEEELRTSREQLAGVINSAMDAIVTIDENQTIVLFNNAAERMFLYPSEDALGQKLDRFIPDRFRGSHKDHIQNFGRTHVTKRSMGSLGALYGLRADGEEFPIEASISQLESSGRKLYTVILRDITERQHTEEKLTEQTKILDLAPVLIRDLNSRIVFWNRGAEQMYGWSAAEVNDKVSHVIFQTAFPQPLEEIKARLYSRDHWQGDLAHTRKDGQRIIVASQWVLHRDDNGKPKAILEINNDITDRRKAEEEIRRLNAELEARVVDRTAELQAVNKELEAFSYSVSHDLRAPLRHINGFSQALAEDCAEILDENGRMYLQEIRAASREMAQLIDDVLRLAKVARTELQRQSVDLSELAHNIVARFSAIETDRSVDVDIEDGITASGDKRLLEIVLTNLLSNAWKFTAKRELAQISFHSRSDNGELVCFIRDNGAGFDMTFADKLFGAFQRLHTAEEFEGTGVGLATVQRVINRHGGRVWAEGEPEKGATFFFSLPSRKEVE
ncbi:MAG TPA: PAS domain S-box protein [Pyrinomonadaceae bacterium]